MICSVLGQIREDNPSGQMERIVIRKDHVSASAVMQCYFFECSEVEIAFEISAEREDLFCQEPYSQQSRQGAVSNVRVFPRVTRQAPSSLTPFVPNQR